MAMNRLTPKRSLAGLCALSLLGAIVQPAPAQIKPSPRALPSPSHFADYDSEPRRADGHVDGDALLARLKELHVTTYYWLVWHAATDWDDLKLFLPKAAQANLQVWVYLVPPSESAPQDGSTLSRAVSAGLRALGGGNRPALAPAHQPDRPG